MSVTINLTPKELLAFSLNFPHMVELAEANIKSQLENRGRQRIGTMLGKWQTGRLKDSLEVSVIGETVRLVIGAELDYTRAVFSGAVPHMISPRTGKSLYWNRFGRDFFFQKVKHPGQKARFDILISLQELALEVIKKELEEIIKVLQWA